MGAVFDQPADHHSADGRQHQNDPDRSSRVAHDVPDAYVLTVVDGNENEAGENYCDQSKTDNPAQVDARGTSVIITHTPAKYPRKHDSTHHRAGRSGPSPYSAAAFRGFSCDARRADQPAASLAMRLMPSMRSSSPSANENRA